MKNATSNIYHLHAQYFFMGLVLFLNVSCTKEDEADLLPKIGDLKIYQITTHSAEILGIITGNNGSKIADKGVCWSTSNTPTKSNNVVSAGSGFSNFLLTITGLNVYTTYYIRVFATNESGTAYSEEMAFTTQGGMVTDIDGNNYPTISIGSQVWLMENLRATRYRNGDSIPYVEADQKWGDPTSRLTAGAYCFYNNDLQEGNMYGALYNWDAVTDMRNLAPDGWHIPTGAEWEVLVSYVDRNGGKLKESGFTHWKSPNLDAINDSGFTALPGGSRNLDGRFEYISEQGYFWTSTPYTFGGGGGYFGYVSYDTNEAGQRGIEGGFGFSVRCIRD